MPDLTVFNSGLRFEYTTISNFESSLLGQDINFEVEDIDIKRYIKFLLKDGSIDEKREILNCFDGKIVLNQKRVELSQQK